MSEKNELFRHLEKKFKIVTEQDSNKKVPRTVDPSNLKLIIERRKSAPEQVTPLLPINEDENKPKEQSGVKLRKQKNTWITQEKIPESQNAQSTGITENAVPSKSIPTQKETQVKNLIQRFNKFNTKSSTSYGRFGIEQTKRSDSKNPIPDNSSSSNQNCNDRPIQPTDSQYDPLTINHDGEIPVSPSNQFSDTPRSDQLSVYHDQGNNSHKQSRDYLREHGDSMDDSKIYENYPSQSSELCVNTTHDSQESKADHHTEGHKHEIHMDSGCITDNESVPTESPRSEVRVPLSEHEQEPLQEVTKEKNTGKKVSKRNLKAAFCRRKKRVKDCLIKEIERQHRENYAEIQKNLLLIDRGEDTFYETQMKIICKNKQQDWGRYLSDYEPTGNQQTRLTVFAQKLRNEAIQLYSQQPPQKIESAKVSGHSESIENSC